jgi:hypothetical protein
MFGLSSMLSQELLMSLRNSGFTFTAQNAHLLIAPAQSLTNSIKQAIRENKTEILCILHREDELKRLILLVCEYHNFSQEHYTDALKCAKDDQVNALICFTTLARKAGLING